MDDVFIAVIQLGRYLIGATMSGNVPGGKVVRERPLVGAGVDNKNSGFVQHLITTGLETLFEGVTVATIHQDYNFHKQKMKPLVYGSDMIECMKIISVLIFGSH